MEKVKERIVSVYLEDEMKDSYIDYAMSVIVGRALPDVRDGLKPVHRRILYAMHELNLRHNQPYKKSARVVGDCLGKFHPHGDMAVYDALVRMVQDFSLRYPLIDGQGNYGSVDGDAAAAMRYTEARMAPIASEMLGDLGKDTVDFIPNFDDTLAEPQVLPSNLPNLLVNGSSGIAVGMATNIPPHNLSEAVDGIVMLIDNPESDLKALMKAIQGPDFPTGGIICGREGIIDAYQTGRGLIKLRARVYIERQKAGKEAIVVTEIPYQANKSSLIASIADLVQSKRLEGITDLRDESDREGMRIVIELRRDQNAQVVLNQLYKHTALGTTFGVIMLALVDGRPRVLNLKQMISSYIDHRKEVVRRRSQYELNKAQDRAHILEGLKKALDNLDRIVKTIRSSKTPQQAKEALIKNFSLSPQQSQAILEMQLAKLTGLERQKVDQEYLDLIKSIALYKSILADPRKILEVVKEEALELKDNYGDERRTEIVTEIEELEIEDLIQEKDVAIIISHSGYIKRLPVSSYRRQRRGGRGVTGIEMRKEDFAEHFFIASTHDYILFFTNKGRVHWLKVYEIPEVGRAAKGKAIVNILRLSPGESVTAQVEVKEFDKRKYLVMATKLGLVKKTNLMAYSRPKRGGIIGLTLKKGDELIGCELTDGKQEIMLATRAGKAIRFKESQVRDMGRAASGVKGISLAKNEQVIGMEIVREGASVLTVTEKGFGKRTELSQYRRQSRGGKGIVNIKVTKRNEEAVGIKMVTNEDEIMIITSSGMVVRCPVKDIRSSGRSTQGVKVISLEKGDKVCGLTRVAAGEEED